MSRLLNCCGRRKKTLLDLKDSMLGPFMLLALRGESSFIQVSGFVVLDRSKALISGCLKIILIRFPRPSGTVAGTGKKNSPIADRRVPSNDSRNNRITQDCSCLLVSSVMNYPYSTAKMISRSFLCYLSHLKPSSRCFYASADWPVSYKNLKTKKSSRWFTRRVCSRWARINSAQLLTVQCLYSCYLRRLQKYILLYW